MNMHTKAAGGGGEVALAAAFDAHHKAVEDALKKSGMSVAEISARLSELEQKAVRRPGGYPEPETWGSQVAASEQYKALAGTQDGKVRIGVKTTITTGTTSGGPLGTVDHRTVPNMLPQRRIRVRDVLTPGRTASTAVEYPRQTTRTNNAATVAETAQKPESALAWETVSVPVRTIAHLMPASKQVLDDVPMLQSIIDGELRYMLADVEEGQLLNGGGTGTDLSGVYTQATAFTPPFTIVAPTMIDVLLLAIAQTNAAGFEADSITVNPLDWAKIQLLKDTQGRHLAGSPFSSDAVARLWRTPVVETQAMTADKFMVGSSIGAQVFDRQDVTIEISTEHSDFFAKNLVMMRAEERLALAVYRPLAWTKGDFSDAITAATVA